MKASGKPKISKIKDSLNPSIYITETPNIKYDVSQELNVFGILLFPFTLYMYIY